MGQILNYIRALVKDKPNLSSEEVLADVYRTSSYSSIKADIDDQKLRNYVSKLIDSFKQKTEPLVYHPPVAETGDSNSSAEYYMHAKPGEVM
jgi:predicted Zn-dependent peptidase